MSRRKRSHHSFYISNGEDDFVYVICELRGQSHPATATTPAEYPEIVVVSVVDSDGADAIDDFTPAMFEELDRAVAVFCFGSDNHEY